MDEVSDQLAAHLRQTLREQGAELARLERALCEVLARHLGTLDAALKLAELRTAAAEAALARAVAAEAAAPAPEEATVTAPSTGEVLH